MGFRFQTENFMWKYRGPGAARSFCATPWRIQCQHSAG